MPAKAALKPAEAPQKSRLLRALDLVIDEAVEILSAGRNPRAFQQTEKLIAIARALRQEAAVSVEDLLEEDECIKGDLQMQQAGQFHYRGAVGQNIVVGGADQAWGPRDAQADMQREEKLAGLEGLAARRRRDEAETRLALIREFKELNELDLESQPEEIKEGVAERLTEITEALRSKNEPDEPEAVEEEGSA